MANLGLFSLILELMYFPQSLIHLADPLEYCIKQELEQPLNLHSPPPSPSVKKGYNEHIKIKLSHDEETGSLC